MFINIQKIVSRLNLFLIINNYALRIEPIYCNI